MRTIPKNKSSDATAVRVPIVEEVESHTKRWRAEEYHLLAELGNRYSKLGTITKMGTSRP